MAKRTKRLTSQGEEPEAIRINKFLSDAGVCSRREADRYITEGNVKIDGVVAEMGSRVTKESQVTFFDKPVKREEKLVLIAFNKPEGIVCTTDQNEPDNIIDYINYGMRIYPIGRLDKDSEGLILLTNDGNIVNKILRAENKHEKEYIVTVNKEINAEFIKGMSSGVPILDTVTNPCTLSQIDKYTFQIILTQGLNRQIRRMCEYFGYRVVKLKRVRIMNIQLGRLKTGDYRNVTEKEIDDLNESFQTERNSGKSIKAQEQQISASEVRTRKHEYKNSDSRKPGYRKSEHRDSGERKPEQKRLEQGKPEQRRLEHGKPEQRMPERKNSDQRKPEQKKQEQNKPEQRRLEHEKSELKKPELRTLEHGKPEYQSSESKKTGYRKQDDRSSQHNKKEFDKKGVKDRSISKEDDLLNAEKPVSSVRGYMKKVSLKESRGSKTSSYSERENRPRKGYKPVVDFNRGNVKQSRYGSK